jgi:hypothetical protein
MENVIVIKENELKNLFTFLDRVQLNPEGNSGIKEVQAFMQILAALNTAQPLESFEQQLINNFKEGENVKEKK